MANPIDKLKKIKGRSWDELRTRSGQAVAAYGEKIGFGGRVPTDEEFERLLVPEPFAISGVSAESLWLQFFRGSEERFFPSFKRPYETAAVFRSTFGVDACGRVTAAADRIIDGRIDLLGLSNVYIGTEIDWNFEPVSRTRSPLKHWKEFDDLDTAESGDKKIVWELNRHQHFFTLGAAYLLTKDERYSDMFARHLESWMAQNPPGLGINWASSLEVSFRAISWIWAFHFFKDSPNFKPDLLRRAFKYLYLHGRHIEKYLSKYYSPNTHLTGEALGLYYLGTQMPFLERSGHWRELGEKILFQEITRQVYEDGVYFEQSTWYQRYTVDFYMHFVILKSLANNEPGGAPADGLEKRLQAALEFLMHTTRPDGTTPLIGDDDGGRMLPITTAAANDFRGTLSAGAMMFGRGDLKSVAGKIGEEVLWLFGTEGIQAYGLLDTREPKQASRSFPVGGYYTMRDGWLDTDNFVIVDCGEVGAMSGGHGHADALSVEIALQGRTLLVDPGTYTYHGSREMRDHFRSTIAHNSVTVDDLSSSEPGSTFGWKTRAEASAGSWISEDRFDFFEGSHNGYGRLERPAGHTRSVLFLKNDYILIRDMVRTTGVHEMSVNLHFERTVRAQVAESGEYAAGDDWRIYSFGDGARWQQNESWTSNNFGNKDNAAFLRFTSKSKGTQELFTFILPADAGSVPPEVTEVEIAGGRAFAILYRGYTDLLVVNDDREQTLSTELFDTNFAFTWARVPAGETVADEYVLIGGSKFVLDGADITGEAGVTDHATIRRMGRELYVKTEKDRYRVSMP